LIITDVFKDAVELTDERWHHITKEHPEIEPYKEKVQEVLLIPSKNELILFESTQPKGCAYKSFVMTFSYLSLIGAH